QGVTPARASGVTAELQQFQFTLRACRLAGESITCNVLITNQGQHRRLALATTGSRYKWTTRIVDDSGREYLADEVAFGSQKISGFKGEGSTEIGLAMPPGVPVLASIRFDGVPR